MYFNCINSSKNVNNKNFVIGKKMKNIKCLNAVLYNKTTVFFPDFVFLDL